MITRWTIPSSLKAPRPLKWLPEKPPWPTPFLCSPDYTAERPEATDGLGYNARARSSAWLAPATFPLARRISASNSQPERCWLELLPARDSPFRVNCPARSEERRVGEEGRSR